MQGDRLQVSHRLLMKNAFSDYNALHFSVQWRINIQTSYSWWSLDNNCSTWAHSIFMSSDQRRKRKFARVLRSAKGLSYHYLWLRINFLWCVYGFGLVRIGKMPFKRRYLHCKKFRIIRSAYRFRRKHPCWDISLGFFVSCVLVGFIWYWFDPFGIGRQTDLYTQELINTALAPGYQSAAKEKIAVVLIDDQTLDRQEMGWPPTYDYYSQLIYRIARQHPKAIFMDILVQRKRPQDARALAIARSNMQDTMKDYPVPLIMAQSAAGKTSLFSGIANVGSARVAWEGDDYPLWVHDSERSGAPTPALALYKYMNPRARRADIGEFAKTAPRLTVQWGATVSPEVVQRQLVSPKAHVHVAPGTWERFLMGLDFFRHSLFMGIDPHRIDAHREEWPYALTVKAQDLASPRVAGLLKDRAVLVGAKITGIPDLIPTPVNGNLPGVYLHAMALDNLMHYGRNYYTNPAPSILVYLGLAALMSFMAAHIILRGTRHPRWWFGSCVFVVFAAVFSSSYFWLRHAPQNWVGLVLLALLVFGWHKNANN